MDRSIEDEFDEYDDDVQNDYTTWGKENQQMQLCQSDDNFEMGVDDPIMRQLSLSSYLSTNRASLNGFTFESSSSIDTESTSLSLNSYSSSDSYSLSSSNVDISSEVVLSKGFSMEMIQATNPYDGLRFDTETTVVDKKSASEDGSHSVSYLYIQMEYCKNGTLEDVIMKGEVYLITLCHV